MNTTETPVIGPDKVMDVRFTPCSIKHGVILQNWRDLPVGDHFILRNGHDPVPLRYQIEAEFPGSLRWEYVARAADDVSVKLTKVKDVAAVGEPACGCSGH
jgi:uncharacterized protein (DUF2249 family)